MTKWLIHRLWTEHQYRRSGRPCKACMFFHNFFCSRRYKEHSSWGDAATQSLVSKSMHKKIPLQSTNNGFQSEFSQNQYLEEINNIVSIAVNRICQKVTSFHYLTTSLTAGHSSHSFIFCKENQSLPDFLYKKKRKFSFLPDFQPCSSSWFAPKSL